MVDEQALARRDSMLESARIAGRTLFAHQPSIPKQAAVVSCQVPGGVVDHEADAGQGDQLSVCADLQHVGTPLPLPWALQGTRSVLGSRCCCGGFGARCQASMVLSWSFAPEG